MAVTAARAKAMALALENASEKPHFDRIALRTPRRTFATLAGDGADINFMFDHALQEFYCEAAPEAFAIHPSGWGAMGVTRCLLNKVDVATFKSALLAAHARANAPLAKKKKAKR